MRNLSTQARRDAHALLDRVRECDHSIAMPDIAAALIATGDLDPWRASDHLAEPGAPMHGDTPVTRLRSPS